MSRRSHTPTSTNRAENILQGLRANSDGLSMYTLRTNIYNAARNSDPFWSGNYPPEPSVRRTVQTLRNRGYNITCERGVYRLSE